MKASIIIPAHNEEQRLPETLRRYAGAACREYGHEFELLVVANGSRDRTEEVARELAGEYPQIKVIPIREAVGKGGAVLAGFRQARGRRIAFADADGATAPESVIELMRALDEVDVAIGSRWLPASQVVRRQPPARRVLSRVFNLSVRSLYGLRYRDTQCGAKAFRRHVAKQLAETVQQTSWAFDVDLLLSAKALGFTVREMPVVWADQDGSKLSVRSTSPQVVKSLWEMKRRQLPADETLWANTSNVEETSPARALRILAVNWRCLRHPQAGGSEVNIFRQARHWALVGHHVTVLTADPGRDYAPERDEVLDGIQVRRRGNRLTVYPRALLYFLRHRHEVDQIVDVSNGIPFFTPLLAGSKPGALLVHHVHGRQWFTEFPKPLAALGWFLERKVVPLVYRNWPVIAVSPTTRRALLKLGYAESQVTVVYNGVEPPQEPAETLPVQPRVVYVGRIKRYKRLHRLVRMIAQLRERFPDIHLDLAGDGDARPEVEALVSELGLQDYVTIHGYVDEQTKANILSSATVFATPSMHEGWGLSVIEANSYGCPAVAYDVPGLRAAIRHGRTGLLAKDDRSFCSALAQVLDDADVRTRLSKGAKDWSARFDWNKSAMETLNVLETWHATQRGQAAA